MKNKTKKPKLITVPVTSLGISFSPGDPHLVAVRGYDATKLSAKLAKVFRKIEKRGRAGLRLSTLDRYRRWSARFLLKIKALREVPEAKKKTAPKRVAPKKPERWCAPAKASAAVAPTSTAQ
jgi:hypothetical protein